MMPHKRQTKLSEFLRGYSVIIGVGIMLFGLFAVYFQTYEHPIYGHINLGRYHLLIGVAAIVAGAFVVIYSNRWKRDVPKD